MALLELPINVQPALVGTSAIAMVAATKEKNNDIVSDNSVH